MLGGKIMGSVKIQSHTLFVLLDRRSVNHATSTPKTSERAVAASTVRADTNKGLQSIDSKNNARLSVHGRLSLTLIAELDLSVA